MKKATGFLDRATTFFSAMRGKFLNAGNDKSVMVVGERTVRKTKIGNISTDFFPASARQEILWEEKIDGLLSDAAIKRIGEFLGTEFRVVLWSGSLPTAYKTGLNSLKKGVFYELRFWHQNTDRSNLAAAYTNLHAFVANIPMASFGADLKKIVKYKIQHIWLIFEFDDGTKLVVTKHHPSKLQANQHVLLTDRVDGYSVKISR